MYLICILDIKYIILKKSGKQRSNRSKKSLQAAIADLIAVRKLFVRKVMNREEMILSSAKAEIIQAAEILFTKIDSLKKLDSAVFNELNDLVYENCDLCVNDATNILYSLMYVLNQPH